MKRFLACSGLVLVLNGCAEGPVVDLEQEFADRPSVSLISNDGTELTGIAGDFCTNAICNTVPEINFATLNYGPLENIAPLTLKIDWATAEIENLELRTYNSHGDIVHRHISYIENPKNTFEIEMPLETDVADIALHVRVDFVNEGVSNYYFPLHLE